ncbi:MAG TPA: mechanosensitive ion channel protein MscS [Rikenellaceae bacterium]|nr:mechanosensitive ion channel protein MscS [Rikenellaceae bacterium]
MRIFKRIILTLAGLLMVSAPSWGVFNEKDLAQTLQVLRYELRKAYVEMEKSQVSYESQDDRQHEELVHLIQSCNELSLMLYSQKQDFTFDLTYALQQVTDQYHNFTQSRMPYDNIISYLDVEIDRYDRLVMALKVLPPELIELPDSLGGSSLLDSLASMFQPRLLPNDSYTDAHADDPEHAGHNHFVGLEEEHEHGSFHLDSLSQVARDSCLFYSTRLLKMFTDIRDHMIEDNEYYETTDKRLKEAYDYAQERYKMVQKKIFIEGQDNFWTILTHVKSYASRAAKDFSDKYGRAYFTDVKSEWRGPMVIGFSFMVLIYLAIATLLSMLIVKMLMRRVKFFRTEWFRKREAAIFMLGAAILFVVVIAIARNASSTSHFFTMAAGLLIEFALLLIAVLTSLLIRHDSKQINYGMRSYTPIMLMGLLVITFRIIFIPNSLIALIFPPLLVVFGFWQWASIHRNGPKVPKSDNSYAIASFVVTVITFVISIVGYSLLGLQVYIWWIFQLTVLQLIVACDDLLRKYRHKRVDVLVRAYRLKHQNDVGKDKGSFILVTWLYDLVEMVCIPVLYLLSIPFCLYMASEVFDLTEICMDMFFYPFFNYEYLHLSVSKMVLAAGLFYVFKYICYVARALYRIYKLRKTLRQTGASMIRENELNLTLANNVIGILAWGTYFIVTISLLNIPTKSLSVITAGLAAGLGFAMKDILNNFFYGVQLMSGRLRVGDYIECDGIRGKVDNITYQSTQIEATDGSIMAFPNSSLFAKNFKNLTRNNSYEFLGLPVGVAYGTDVEQTRQVILKALAPLRRADKFGRPVVEESYGIQVVLNGFGDSSVDLVVKQYVLVDQRVGYIAVANERIYNALNESGIEIPFPQRDINIRQVPSSDGK